MGKNLRQQAVTRNKGVEGKGNRIRSQAGAEGNVKKVLGGKDTLLGKIVLSQKDRTRQTGQKL
jgi:hypothetical protein